MRCIYTLSIRKKLLRNLLARKQRNSWQMLKEKQEKEKSEKEKQEKKEKEKQEKEKQHNEKQGRKTDYYQVKTFKDEHKCCRMVQNQLATTEWVATCKTGFLAGCRPLIGLDGCFLKEYYGGQILSVVAQDGNNAFYVLAFVVVDVENRDNWTWFLRNLVDNLGGPELNSYSFISDRHKPMDAIKGLSEGAWNWLKKIPIERWSRSAFDVHTKNPSMTNNMSEQCNGQLLKVRSKPIITMAEGVRMYIMKKLARHAKVQMQVRNASSPNMPPSGLMMLPSVSMMPPSCPIMPPQMRHVTSSAMPNELANASSQVCEDGFYVGNGTCYLWK
ncbi:hypothetical protein CRG98_009547 [Punica granatum]|uniref:MULE transposase domain-containing protein n=1 Tax=Punica granatum TaxID=22663 RepID=A0A2I0KNM1_PUNGR|nr:hypothetical protein CRG98_009547 [Punica granatum]